MKLESAIEQETYSMTRKRVGQEKHLVRRIYWRGDRSESVTIEFAPPPVEQRALEVHRVRQFKAGQRPTVQTVIDALIEKYGEPTSRNRHMLYWQFDPDGKRTRAPERLSSCRDNMIHWGGAGTGRSSYRDHQSIPLGLKPGEGLRDCGIVLTISVGASALSYDANSEVASISSSINNYPAQIKAAEELLAWAEARDAAAEAERIEKARKVEAPKF